MTARKQRSYRFETAAQWNACLFDRVDRDTPGTPDGLRSVSPYAQVVMRHPTQGARSPAATRTGEVLWLDEAGLIHRLPGGGDEKPAALAAPPAMARAARLVSTSGGLWAAGDSPESLQCYEHDTFTRLCSVEAPGARVVDIAAGPHETIAALVERNGTWQSIRIDCAGQVVETVTFDAISQATAFVFLPHSKRFVVLADRRHPRLYWFAAQGGRALSTVAIADLGLCFTASALGSDARGRIFMAGADDEAHGGRAYVLILDADGSELGDVTLHPRDTPVTGIAVTRNSLLVTGPLALQQFSLASTVPDSVGEVHCSLITPALDSPDLEGARRWLRVEAWANLPEGTTLELSIAATDEAKLRDELVAIAADTDLPASQRFRALRGKPGIVWQPALAFHGAGATEPSAVPRAAPLFDVRERYLWVCVTLSAAAGAQLPALTKLAVLYPGNTLMEHLPAVYQRDEAQPASFLRTLVSVLETTTQGLDARIAALGSNVHPATATAPWLDFVAGWLGLPWDDALDDRQKRCITAHAAELARGRGTRSGLEVLLACLLPEEPRRFLVTDATADFGFATVGGGACRGSALPAILGGLTKWSPKLDSSAVLGTVRLPCEGQLDDGAWQLAGQIRVDVAASASERSKWGPWLLPVITQMVPLTARVKLRWVSARALHGNRLGKSLILEAASLPRLGTDAITGIARLPERRTHAAGAGPELGAHTH